MLIILKGSKPILRNIKTLIYAAKIMDIFEMDLKRSLSPI